MPRIVYEDQGLTGGIGDIVSNLAGGLVQGYGGQILTEQERDRAQRDQALGNPYQRMRRSVLWGALPEDVRSAPNARLYQELIAGGADPTTVLSTHRELSADPAYGDAKTQASRATALKAAQGAGLLDATDEAGAEAVRRGELTIGQLHQRRQAQKLKDDEEAKGKKEKAGRAQTLAKELGVGQPTPPAAVPTFGGGNVPTGFMPIPATPGTEFQDPQDVVHVASERRLRDTAAATAADKAADNARQSLADQQRARIAQDRLDAYVQHLQSKNAQATPEDIDNLADLVHEQNPAIRPSQARAWAEAKLKYKTQLPFGAQPQDTPEAKTAWDQIQGLEQQAGQMEAQAQQKEASDLDEEKALGGQMRQRAAALRQQIELARQAYVQKFGQLPAGWTASQPGAPNPTQPARADPAAQAAGMSDEELKALIRS